jgi:uncharacterized protein YbaR (Trm112 family)
MDTALLEVLACPVCKGELLYHKQDQELICRFDRIAFPVVHDIPMMVIARARRLDSGEE